MATISPTTSSTIYNYLLRLLNCTGATISNLELNGQLYSNSTGSGTLLRLEGNIGTTTVTDVHVARNRGKTSDSTESGLAFGIFMKNCGTVNLTACTGDDTGYATWRTKGTDNVTYSYCRSENPWHRCIAERTDGTVTPAETVDTIQILNSDFIRDAPRGASTNTYSLMMNINPVGEEITTFLMQGCTVDWTKAEGGGYSWDFNDPPPEDSCVLMKIQGIHTATFQNCKFLHGGNKYPTTKPCHTLKTDPAPPVKRLYIYDCDLSGNIAFSDTDQSQLVGLIIRGCRIQMDNHFNTPAGFEGVEYPNFQISASQSGGLGYTSIDHVRAGNALYGVIREEYTSFDPYWSWSFRSVNATTDSAASGDTLFVSGQVETPTLSDVDPTGVDAFKAANQCVNPNGDFKFSSQDPTSIDEG